MALKFSVVIPIFNEEKNLDELMTTLLSAMETMREEYEVIFVDDASKDESYVLLEKLAFNNPRIKVIQFRRNCGQTAAIMAGITFSHGEIIITMDGDLQNDPADIPLMVNKLNEGYDMVSGWRKDRNDAYFSRVLPSILANKLISLISGVPLQDYGCTLKVYRGEMIRELRLYGEMHRFIPIFMAWEGAKIAEMPIRHYPRKHGLSKYGLSRVFKVSLDLLTIKFLESYTTKPIYIFGGIGLFLNLLGLVSIVWRALLGNEKLGLPGGIVILMGVQFLLMGILAELVTRAYHETTHKGTYKIRRKINLDP